MKEIGVEMGILVIGMALIIGIVVGVATSGMGFIPAIIFTCIFIKGMNE